MFAVALPTGETAPPRQPHGQVCSATALTGAPHRPESPSPVQQAISVPWSNSCSHRLHASKVLGPDGPRCDGLGAAADLLQAAQRPPSHTAPNAWARWLLDDLPLTDQGNSSPSNQLLHETRDRHQPKKPAGPTAAQQPQIRLSSTTLSAPLALNQERKRATAYRTHLKPTESQEAHSAARAQYTARCHLLTGRRHGARVAVVGMRQLRRRWRHQVSRKASSASQWQHI